MSRLLVVPLVLAAALVLVADTARADTMTYTSLTDWQTAVAAIPSSREVLEDFADTTLVDEIDGWTSGWGDAEIADGVFHDSVSDGDPVNWGHTPTQSYTEWTFTQDVFGFGALFDLPVNSPGSGLTVMYTDSSGNTGTVGDIDNELDGFWGFTSSVGLTSVRLYEGDEVAGFETYDMDDLRLAVVPEPGSLVLLGAGALGLLARRRARRRVA